MLLLNTVIVQLFQKLKKGPAFDPVLDFFDTTDF